MCPPPGRARVKLIFVPTVMCLLAEEIISLALFFSCSVGLRVIGKNFVRSLTLLVAGGGGVVFIHPSGFS